MMLAWPVALLGLIALAIPLLIHLLHRGQTRRVALASTRLLRDAHVRRWRRLRLHQPWLLLLRLVLLALATVALAQPYLERSRGAADGKPTVLVAPRVGIDAARAALGETWDVARQRHWLAPGFARLEQDPPAGTAPDWSLVAQADATLAPDQVLHVVAAADAAGLTATRPVLSERVHVTLVNAAPPRVERAELPDAVAVITDAGESAAEARVRAVLDSWVAAGARLAVTRGTPQSAGPARWLVWLSAAPLPAARDGEHRTIAVGRDYARAEFADHDPVAASGAPGVPWLHELRAGRDRIVVMDPAVTDGQISLAEAAPALLGAMLGDAAAWPPADYPVTAEQWTARTARPTAVEPLRQSLLPLLVWLLVAAFAAERVVSARAWRRHAHE